MREIKFKAWIKSYECMIYLKQSFGKYDFEDGFVASFSIDGYDGFWAHERFNVKDDDMILMQFTGLKDKNGKEIYEGDIVSQIGNDLKSKGKISYAEICAAFIVEWAGISAGELLYHLTRPIEIIGNIYEHPHLINQTSSV